MSSCPHMSYIEQFLYTVVNKYPCTQVRTQNFSLGGGGLEATYNLCSILKIVLQKSYRMYNCNITLFATVFIYIQI
jgi:hypothetical protein